MNCIKALVWPYIFIKSDRQHRARRNHHNGATTSYTRGLANLNRHSLRPCQPCDVTQRSTNGFIKKKVGTLPVFYEILYPCQISTYFRIHLVNRVHMRWTPCQSKLGKSFGNQGIDNTYCEPNEFIELFTPGAPAWWPLCVIV